jgi:hypothetical protein
MEVKNIQLLNPTGILDNWVDKFVSYNWLVTIICFHFCCIIINTSFFIWPDLKLVPADMRIMPSGSGSEILDLDWFLIYRDIKLVIQASKIEGKDYF